MLLNKDFAMFSLNVQLNLAKTYFNYCLKLMNKNLYLPEKIFLSHN